MSSEIVLREEMFDKPAAGMFPVVDRMPKEVFNSMLENYLQAISENGRVNSEANSCGLGVLVIRWMIRNDETFAEAYQAARDIHSGYIEEALIDRAINGAREVSRTVMTTPDGSEIVTERETMKPDNRAFSKLVNGRLPEYRDNQGAVEAKDKDEELTTKKLLDGILQIATIANQRAGQRAISCDNEGETEVETEAEVVVEDDDRDAGSEDSPIPPTAGDSGK